MTPVLINNAGVSEKKGFMQHTLKCVVNIPLDLMRLESSERGIIKKNNTFHLDAISGRSPR